MKVSFIFIVFVLVAFHSSAQQKTMTSPWQFHSINSVGLLEGESGSAFQILTINGAQYGSWFGGIGLGIDYYRYRTVPLFFDFRKEFGKKLNKLFAYLDGGINFSWVTDNQKMAYVISEQFHNGFYGDLGFGYKAGIGKKDHLLLSLGYSYKYLSETYLSPVYNNFFINADNYSSGQEKISYELNRINIKMSWEF